MWYRTVTRKELVEIFSSTLGDRSDRSSGYETSVPRAFKTGDSVLLGWGEDPSSHPSLPSLAVANESELTDLLALVNASPQLPSPFTAFCRVIGKKEFLQYGDSLSLDLAAVGLTPFIALSYAEALVLADGQIKFTDLSPAICERTLSLTWAKGVAARVSISQFGHLVEAWADVYTMTGDASRGARVDEMVGAMLPVIRTISELQLGAQGSASPEAAFCRALLDRSKERQEAAWLQLSAPFPGMATLSGISEATREERGQLFQQAVRSGASPFVMALLAAQISPGTLDHIEIALSQKDPRVVFWYAALAALARPHAILTAQGSLGLRLQRLVSRLSDFDEYPGCDLSYLELRVLSRLGLEHLSKSLKHAGELSVELIPLVTGVFRFSVRSGRSDSDQDRTVRERQTRERQRERLLSIARMIEELAYSQQLEFDSSDSKSRKTSTRR